MIMTKKNSGNVFFLETVVSMAKKWTDDHVTFIGIFGINPFDPIYIFLSNICNFNTHSILSQKLLLYLSPYSKMYSYSELYLDFCLSSWNSTLLALIRYFRHINPY